MTYKEIMYRAGLNVGIDSLSQADISVMKRYIFDIVTELLRKTDTIKSVYELDITTDDEDAQLPTDFYAPLDVVVTASDNSYFNMVEISYEDYLKWNPNIVTGTTSFAELVTDATPDQLYWTRQNEDFDGKVGYFFTDTFPIILKWKPAIAGAMQIYYSSVPASEITTLTGSPTLHAAFHEAVVLGVTIKWLRALIIRSQNQERTFTVSTALRVFEKEYDKILGDLGGFTNRTTTTHRVEQFDFLNDAEMLL